VPPARAAPRTPRPRSHAQPPRVRSNATLLSWPPPQLADATSLLSCAGPRRAGPAPGSGSAEVASPSLVGLCERLTNPVPALILSLPPERHLSFARQLLSVAWEAPLLRSGAVSLRLPAMHAASDQMLTFVLARAVRPLGDRHRLCQPRLDRVPSGPARLLGLVLPREDQARRDRAEAGDLVVQLGRDGAVRALGVVDMGRWASCVDGDWRDSG